MPDAQTDASVTGLPLASTHAELLDGEPLDDELLAGFSISFGVLLSDSAAYPDPEMARANMAPSAEPSRVPCFIMSLMENAPKTKVAFCSGTAMASGKM